MILSFADCEIHVERRELRRRGEVVHIEPQVLDLLLYLIRHRERVVTKEELLLAVWEGRSVSEATLSSRISAARQAIGDAGDRQTCLGTVARRGFRFHAAVEERMPSYGARTAPAERHITSNLPAQPASLLGRDRDIHDLTAMLASVRLVTLTGPGGVGKTRLAIQVAAVVAANYPDGVWFVEFAPLNDPAAVAHWLAGVMGITQQPGKTIEQSVIAALSARRVLLVLDNCEHLIELVARLARDILARCPLATVLATSREPLLTAGEQAWPVSPLNCDGIASPAVQLFTDRARAVAPHFTPTGDASAVCEICSRLDGIPLAIELAAARTRVLSPSQICERLGQALRLLTVGVRSAEARHLSLRRAIQWSYDLLTSAESALFVRLSVFAGGFALKAAERICGGDLPDGEVFDLLDSLVRKSLVTVDRTGTSVRYGQLETIRQFADEQLTAKGNKDNVRSRHALFFAEDAAVHFQMWRSPNQPAAYQWLESEIGNLHSAFRWACEKGQVDTAARIASFVGDMGRFCLRGEAAMWAAEVVDAARNGRHPRLMVLLTWAASTAWSVGELVQAERYGQEAISLVDDPRADQFVWAYADLAMVASYEGDVNRAIQLARAGATQPADELDRFCLALLPYHLAVAGKCDEAIALADQILTSVESTGIPSSICVALWANGKAFASANAAKALASYERCIAIARESGNRLWEVMGALEVAALQASRMDPIAALKSFRRMMELWRSSTDLILISHGIGSLIVLLSRLGFAFSAAVLIGAVSSALRANPFVAQLPEATVCARQALGDDTFEEAIRRGGLMEFHQICDYAQIELQQALISLCGDS